MGSDSIVQVSGKKARLEGGLKSEVPERCNPVRELIISRREEGRGRVSKFYREVVRANGRTEEGKSARGTRETGRLIYNAKWISRRGGGNDRPRWARLILNL